MPQPLTAAPAQAAAPIILKTVVQRLLPSAVLAPSAHNTQPWQFRVSQSALEFFVDRRRHLAVSDPAHRQLFISLGCAIENAAVAARYFGYEPQLRYFPDGQSEELPVARLTINADQRAQGNESTHELFSAIGQRRTDRTLYDAQPLTAAEHKHLPASTAPNLIFIEDRAAITALAQLTAQATEATLSRHDFKAELSHWVRHNWTRQPDGMPGYAMGIPAAVSLLAPLMVRFVPIHKQEGPKTRQQIESASAVAVIATSTDTPADWLNSGQLLEQIWLEATAAGLATAPLVAAVEAGAGIRAQLQETLRINLFPQSILRVGHSKQTNLRPTPRRTVEDCLRN